MAKITRRMAEEEIQKTLNEYNKKIEDAKNYIDYLPLEVKKLVESYEKNVDNRKALLNKVVEDKSFFETLTDEQVYRLLKICEELITKFDLEIKEDNKVLEQKNILDKAIILLEEYGDEKSQKAIREYKNGKRSILFGKLSKNIYGITKNQNSIYTHIITNEFEKDTIENQIQVAVTLAHEFKRNAVSNSINTETRDIVLEDTKIIESFANKYGEEIYKKFPEYGILHYIKKIFGETELEDFADYAFDSTGSYWKVNEAGDLIDDGNTTKVFDKDGKEQPLIHQSDNNGRQGTLEKWLGVNNANTSLMSIAGYVWDDTKKKWIVNPGQIKYDKIKEAHSTGKITDDQYNLILLAAGQSTSYDDKSKKISLINQLLTDYQKENAIKTQTQINFVNRTWEWLGRKWNKWFGKKTLVFSKALQENLNIKEERKWGNNEHHCDEYCEAVLKFANNSSFDSTQSLQKVEVSELDRFIEIVRNTVGASYDHTRSPTESKMDCSGIFVYAMQQLGYKIDKHLTAARMASGQISGIILYDTVDNGRQGNKGVLNFYKWGTSTVQHVNYGVGKNESETDPQIIDASEGDTWQTNRNKNEKQIKKAKKDTINQTWAPFSTRTKPDIQAYLDFSKFNKEIEIK